MTRYWYLTLLVVECLPPLLSSFLLLPSLVQHQQVNVSRDVTV